VKNELMVLVESVEPRESSMDVSSIREMRCVICIVLFEVLLPELLVEGVVGLVFPSADRVLELENKIKV
jgi:hypothetical protein